MRRAAERRPGASARPVGRPAASRRAFVLLAGTALVAGGVACGRDDDGRAAPTVLEAPADDAPVEGVVDVITTEPWARERVGAEFASASGCRAQFDVAPSDQGAARRALDRGGRFDVVSAGGLTADLLLRGNAVQPLDEDALTNLADVEGALRAPPDVMREGRRFGVPFAWDADLLAFDPRTVVRPPASWEALYDPAYRGRITVPDGPLQLGHAALVLPAPDPWALTPTQLRDAAALARTQAPLVRRWWRTPAEAAALLRTGAVDLAQLPTTAVAALRRAGTPVEAVLPAEGTTGRVTSWLLGRRAAHPVCAYRWLEWSGSPEGQAVLAEVGGRAPVSAAACEILAEARCRALRVGDEALLDAVRFARAPDEPTGLAAWEEAWATVRRAARP